MGEKRETERERERNRGTERGGKRLGGRKRATASSKKYGQRDRKQIKPACL